MRQGPYRSLVSTDSIQIPRMQASRDTSLEDFRLTPISISGVVPTRLGRIPPALEWCIEITQRSTVCAKKGLNNFVSPEHVRQRVSCPSVHRQRVSGVSKSGADIPVPTSWSRRVGLRLFSNDKPEGQNGGTRGRGEYNIGRIDVKVPSRSSVPVTILSVR